MTKLADHFFERTDFSMRDGIHLIALAPEGTMIGTAIMSGLAIKGHAAWFSVVNLEKPLNVIPQPGIKSQRARNILVTDEVSGHYHKLEGALQLIHEIEIEVDLITAFVATDGQTVPMQMGREIPVVPLFQPEEVTIKTVS